MPKVDTDVALQLAPLLAGLIVVACVALIVLISLYRRSTLPKPILVREDWKHLQQRRFFNPGAVPRALTAACFAAFLVGGVVVGPFLLGFAEGPTWYLRVDWLVVLFAAIVASIVATYLLLPKRPRCPSCKTTALDKDLARHPKVRIYLCRQCQVVWQTRWSPPLRMRDGSRGIPRNF